MKDQLSKPVDHPHSGPCGWENGTGVGPACVRIMTWPPCHLLCVDVGQLHFSAPLLPHPWNRENHLAAPVGLLWVSRRCGCLAPGPLDESAYIPPPCPLGQQSMCRPQMDDLSHGLSVAMRCWEADCLWGPHWPQAKLSEPDSVLAQPLLTLRYIHIS